MGSNVESLLLSEEGAAEWPATGLENRGGSKGQGFDSFTLLQRLSVRAGVMQSADILGPNPS